MKVALVTGIRADRGALEMVDRALSGHETWWITAVSGRTAEDPHDAVTVATDSAEFVSASLRDHRPDFVVLHGDRHEILGAAMAANIMGVPIAHLGGGDVTEGSQDDCFRHAITKLSHLHFSSHQDAADRILRMGEHPDCVHAVGCPGIDRIVATPVMTRNETFATVGLKTPERCLLVVFHPNTLGDTLAELDALSRALQARPAGTAIVLIGPNADAGAELIQKEWFRLAHYHDVAFWPDLPAKTFLSLMRWCDVMVGNSSAGFYEAPCFGMPVVNIGDRQLGRPNPGNVIDCPPEWEMILANIMKVLQPGYICSAYHSLYGDGHAAERIVKVLASIADPRALLRKKWYSPKMTAGHFTVSNLCGND